MFLHYLFGATSEGSNILVNSLQKHFNASIQAMTRSADQKAS
jgi:hypothetical protein